MFPVLEPVTEVSCEPVVTQDCRNESVQVPYIKEVQQCDEVTFDECQDVQRSVPVDICKRRRFNEDSIFLSRGKVFRKEGEIRRKTLFRKPFNLDTQKKNSTSQQTSSSSPSSANRPSTVNNPQTTTETNTDNSDNSNNETSEDFELNL